MHALLVGSNAELEAAESSGNPAPAASVLLHGAQAMLVQQQQQGQAAQAAVFAAKAALLQAQVNMTLYPLQPLMTLSHRGCIAVCLLFLPSH